MNDDINSLQLIDTIEYLCPDGLTITIRKDLILDAGFDNILFDDYTDDWIKQVIIYVPAEQEYLYLPKVPNEYIYYHGLYLDKYSPINNMFWKPTLMDKIEQFSRIAGRQDENI